MNTQKIAFEGRQKRQALETEDKTNELQHRLALEQHKREMKQAEMKRQLELEQAKIGIAREDAVHVAGLKRKRDETEQDADSRKRFAEIEVKTTQERAAAESAYINAWKAAGFGGAELVAMLRPEARIEMLLPTMVPGAVGNVPVLLNRAKRVGRDD